MMIRSLCILQAPILASGAIGQGLGEQVQSADRHQATIDHERSGMDSIGVALEGFSAEGGEAWGYFRPAGELSMIHAWLFDETGRSLNMFYFQGDQLTLAVDVEDVYDRPIQADDHEGDPIRMMTLTRHTYFSEGRPFYREDLGQMGGEEVRAMPDSVQIALAKDLRQRILGEHALKRSLPGKDLMAIDPALEHRRNCPALRPDVQLAGITFLDEASAVKVTGGVTAEMLIDDHIDMPRVHFRSGDGSQYLSLFFHYGGVVNAFSEFKVSRTEVDPVVKDLPVTDFVSGKGISLGMTPNDVIGRLGGCFRSGDADNGHRLLTYAVSGPDDPFLKRFGYPSYYATLEFAAGELIEYRFGFEYP